MTKNISPVSLKLGALSLNARMFDVSASTSDLATTVQISIRVGTEDAQKAINALKAAGLVARVSVRDDQFRGQATYRVVDPENKRPAGVAFTF